jgi:hypothetical protein
MAVFEAWTGRYSREILVEGKPAHQFTARCVEHKIGLLLRTKAFRPHSSADDPDNMTLRGLDRSRTISRTNARNHRGEWADEIASIKANSGLLLLKRFRVEISKRWFWANGF